MLPLLFNTWPLLIGILLLMAGNGLHGTLISVRGDLENFSPQLMGYVIAAYYAGYLGGALFTPKMLKRVGHVRVFAALASLVSAAFVLYPAFVHPLWWVVLRFVVGFCFSGIYVTAESWLNDMAPNEHRGKLLSVYLIMHMLGNVIGQGGLLLADPGGYTLFIIMSVIVSVAFTPILLSVSRTPVQEESRSISFRELYIASPLGFVGTLILGAVLSGLFSMSSVYATAESWTLLDISKIVVSVSVGALLFQYPIGLLSDKYDRRILIMAATGAGMVFCAMALVFKESILLTIVFTGLAGGTALPLYGLLVAYTNDYVERDKMTSVSGALMFMNGLGATAGPIIIGYAMSLAGPNGYFICIIVLMGAIFGYAFYRMFRRAAVENMSPYSPLSPRSTSVAMKIVHDAKVDDDENNSD